MDIPKPEGWENSFELLERTVTFDQAESNDGEGQGFAIWHDEPWDVEFKYHYLAIAPDMVGERIQVTDWRVSGQPWNPGQSWQFHRDAHGGWVVNPSGLPPGILELAPAWDVGPEKFPTPVSDPGDTSDERAVSKLIADMLSAAEISGIEQVAQAGDDDDLKLPAIVVGAKFEEEARALKKNGRFGARYRVDIELRGIRTKPGTAGLDAIQAEIDAAMSSVPFPLPASAAAFSYFLVDERLGAESNTGEETRELSRSYSVFALLT